MAITEGERVFDNFDAALDYYKNERGTPGYSEQYNQYPTSCRLTNGKLGWVVKYKTYSG